LTNYLSILFHRIKSDMEYDEQLTLKVRVNTNGKEKTLANKSIGGRKQYNSWFYFAFKKEIVFLKGTKCAVQIWPMSEASYLLIGEDQVRDSLRAAKCSATKMEVGPHDRWIECEPQNYIIKSVSFKLI